MYIEVPGITLPVEIDQPIYKGSNFTWSEATKVGGRVSANETITANIIRLARKLDEVRELFGGNPIFITSWYRPPFVNRKVGGGSNSQHLNGGAVDFCVEGFTPSEVQVELEDKWEGGMGYGRTFTHLDIRGYRARWRYGN